MLVLLENGAVGIVEGAGRFWRMGMVSADRLLGIDMAREDQPRLLRLRIAGAATATCGAIASHGPPEGRRGNGRDCMPGMDLPDIRAIWMTIVPAC